jgi:hypothetical protein
MQRQNHSIRSILLSFFNDPHKTIMPKVARLLNRGDEMLRPKCMIAACAFALSIGAANADTIDAFDVQGTLPGGSLSGTVLFDETNPSLSTAAITDFPANSFFDVFVSIDIPLGVLKVQDNNAGDSLDGDTLTIDFSGSSITDGSLTDSSGLKTPLDLGGTITETPLPAALPLFASGLGALGLLGWRRKRKAQAAA